MKTVSTALNRHLNNSRAFRSCDLYEFVLQSGVSYRYSGTDVAVTWNGKAYDAGGPIIERAGIQTFSNVAVDKLAVTIYADDKDEMGGVPLMAVAHNGGLDGAQLNLRRAFFDSNGKVIDVLDVFQGRVEVRQGGGLSLQLDVKSAVQQLNTAWPLRRYYPQCPYCLYSDECGVNIANFRQRVKVKTVPAHNVITIDATFDDGYFDAGGIDWLSGPLVGQTTQVMRSAGGRITFLTAAETPPESGNEAYIYPGCDKTPETCREKFNNFLRNRATPYVPLKETIR